MARAFKKMVRPGSGCGHLVMCAVAGHSNGWSDIPSKKEANKKGGEIKMGEK